MKRMIFERDNATKMIMKNSRVKFDAEKVGHLRSCLIGRARAVAEDLPPSPGSAETSRFDITTPSPALHAIARHHGQERYEYNHPYCG